MSLWKLSRGSHALSTSADSITINVPAGRTLKVLSGKCIGMGNALAAGAEVGVFRVSTNGSGGSPTALVLKTVDPNADGVAAPTGFSAVYGYTTQPTVEADPVIRLGFQPAGGQDREQPAPGAEVSFWKATAHQVSIRGINGTPNAMLELTLELI